MSEREGVRFLLYCGEATRHTRDRVDFPPLLYHNIAMASAGLMEDARPSLSDPPAIPPSRGGINLGRVSVASERGERGSMCSCISVV